MPTIMMNSETTEAKIGRSMKKWLSRMGYPFSPSSRP